VAAGGGKLGASCSKEDAMSKVLCVLVLVVVMGCKLAPNAQDVGQDEAFVSDGLVIKEDSFTKTRTYTGPEFLSKESTFGKQANWIKMVKTEPLDRSSQVYSLVVRTYHDAGNLGFYSSAYDDAGVELKLDSNRLVGKLPAKDEITLITMRPDDISRIIDRKDNTQIKMIGSGGEMIILLPRSYVVDFMAATR
jgi:hypothetical protein